MPANPSAETDVADDVIALAACLKPRFTAADVEAAARAMVGSADLNPDCLYQHNFEGDWPEDERREYRDAFTGEMRTMLFHKAWRTREKAARAALRAVGTLEEDEGR